MRWCVLPTWCMANKRNYNGGEVSGHYIANTNKYATRNTLITVIIHGVRMFESRRFGLATFA